MASRISEIREAGSSAGIAVVAPALVRFAAMKQSLGFPVALLALFALSGLGCGESHVATLDDGGPGRLDAPVAPGTDTGPPTPGVDSGPPTPVVDSGGPMPGVDGGGVVIVDGGPAPTSDAGPPAVSCGTMTCSDPDICCVTFAGGGGGPGGGMPVFECLPDAECMGVTASCDGPEDCASGEACCASGGGGGPGGGGGMGSAMCGAPSDCMFRLCHESTDCQTGAMCCPVPIGGAMISICSTFGCFGGGP